MDSILLAIFKKAPPKEHSCEVWLNLARRFRTRCSLKFYYMYIGDLLYAYIGENKPRTLAAMFFYESGQKCQYSKTITQQLFL